MTQYTITNRTSGLELGTYEGATPADAVEAMHFDAGYASSEAAAETLSTTVESLVADLDVRTV